VFIILKSYFSSLQWPCGPPFLCTPTWNQRKLSRSWWTVCLRELELGLDKDTECGRGPTFNLLWQSTEYGRFSVLPCYCRVLIVARGLVLACYCRLLSMARGLVLACCCRLDSQVLPVVFKALLKPTASVCAGELVWNGCKTWNFDRWRRKLHCDKLLHLYLLPDIMRMVQ
jgi:hypothetical protein